MRPNNAAIAQMVERLICNQDARGSIPRGGTNELESDLQRSVALS